MTFSSQPAVASTPTNSTASAMPPLSPEVAARTSRASPTASSASGAAAAMVVTKASTSRPGLVR
jgi:hypothetical protein